MWLLRRLAAAAGHLQVDPWRAAPSAGRQGHTCRRFCQSADHCSVALNANGPMVSRTSLNGRRRRRDLSPYRVVSEVARSDRATRGSPQAVEIGDKRPHVIHEAVSGQVVVIGVRMNTPRLGSRAASRSFRPCSAGTMRSSVPCTIKSGAPIAAIRAGLSKRSSVSSCAGTQ
jgi:hypothetical protein